MPFDERMVFEPTSVKFSRRKPRGQNWVLVAQWPADEFFVPRSDHATTFFEHWWYQNMRRPRVVRWRAR